MANNASGQNMRVSSSPRSCPSSGRRTPISAARGRSINRDQCEMSGSGAPTRGSVGSNQGAPSSSARTLTRRNASSGSPSQSRSAGPSPAKVAIATKTTAAEAQPTASAKADGGDSPSRVSTVLCEIDTTTTFKC